MGAAASIYSETFDALSAESDKPASTEDVPDEFLRDELKRLRQEITKATLAVQDKGDKHNLGLKVKTRLMAENDSDIKEPVNYNVMDNTLLFLPAKAVDELGLQANMDDKGDTEKTMWAGRVWQLRALLNFTHTAKLKIMDETGRKGIPAERLDHIQTVIADPEKKEMLSRMAARWRGTCLRKRLNLDLLNPLRFANLKGTLVYAHGSGGCSWDNYRLCRMICGQGLLVVAPDGFAYPRNTAMGQMRHKDVRPLIKSDEDCDYWKGDLLYTSGASGELTYSTKAEKVLDDPDSFRDLYERCYQLRRAELHFTIARLPQFSKTQGFFLGGTSEGAMTVSRFDDQRYGGMLIGRFINSFSIEYCYFTPDPEDGELGGQVDVPTLNIIGDQDEFFGPNESVAKAVVEDGVSGYGDKKLDGHGYDSLVGSGATCALVVVNEGGVHAPCDTHDNFLRQLFETFFTRPGAIFKLPKIWKMESSRKDLIKRVKGTEEDDSTTNVVLITVPKMKYPNKANLREVEHMMNLEKLGAHGTAAAFAKELALRMEEEDAEVAKKLAEAHAMVAEIKKNKKFAAEQKKQTYYSKDKQIHKGAYHI